MAAIACIGGAHLDRRALLRAPAVPGSSNPASVATDFGGVARNVAQNLTRLGCPAMLCSRVGHDEAGRLVCAQPLDTSLVSLSDTLPTASYTAILEPNGELVLGIADMDIYEELTPAVLEPALARLRQAALWFVDANLPAATIAWLLTAAGGIPVAADAVSVAKAQRLGDVLGLTRYLFCNLAQAGALAGGAFDGPAAAAAALGLLGAAGGVVSAGTNGIAVYHEGTIATIPAIPAVPRDVTGAGDALVSGVLYGISRGCDLFAAARLGLAAAALTVECAGSTHPHLTPEALDARARNCR